MWSSAGSMHGPHPLQTPYHLQRGSCAIVLLTNMFNRQLCVDPGLSVLKKKICVWKLAGDKGLKK